MWAYTIAMLALVWPSTCMMVCNFAPRSARWVPTVWRKRWAVTVGLPTPLVRDSDVTARDALVEILERHGMPSGEARASATSSPFATTAAGLAERLSEYRAAGVEEVIFDLPAPFDTMTLSKLAEIRAALAR